MMSCLLFYLLIMRKIIVSVHAQTISDGTTLSTVGLDEAGPGYYSRPSTNACRQLCIIYCHMKILFLQSYMRLLLKWKKKFQEK